MRGIMSAFRQLLKVLWEDFMVVACLIGPIFMGAVFKWGVPVLESELCKAFEQQVILAPYYRLFDLLLLIMTPLMVSFAGVMVMLEEIDNSTARYLCVTPIGTKGYLISRLGIPVCFSMVYSVALILLCSISDMTIGVKMGAVVLSSLISIIVSLFVVGVAKNKVEGMALMKLSGLLVAAALIPFFVTAKTAYLGGIFPSFWLGRFALESRALNVTLCILVSVIWVIGLYKGFRKKLV